MSNYAQIVEQQLAAIRVSGQISEQEFRLLNKYTRYIAMLDVPVPKWGITRWICNQFNLVEAWYRWEQAGRMATAIQELPSPLYHQAIDIVRQDNRPMEIFTSTTDSDSSSKVNSTQIITTATTIAITAVAGMVLAGLIGFGTFYVLKTLINTPNVGKLTATIFQTYKQISTIALVLTMGFSMHQYNQGNPVIKSFTPAVKALVFCVSSSFFLKLFLEVN